jgi:hypothetical protein
MERAECGATINSLIKSIKRGDINLGAMYPACRYYK